MQKIAFILNGEEVSLEVLSSTTTLLDWLREEKKLTGTKEGCNEGDCGACTVLVTDLKKGQAEHKALNACILFLPQLDGKSVRTIEGLASKTSDLRIQEEMISNHSSQCGFCTPGIVVSLLTAQLNKDKNYDDILAGNLCRCTGYTPIIEAAIAAEKKAEMPGWVKVDNNKLKKIAINKKSKQSKLFLPQTIKDLEKWCNKNPDGILVGGATDVGLWVTKKLMDLKQICFIGQISEMSQIKTANQSLNIGACTTIETLRNSIKISHPEFSELLRRYGSTQVRNAATIGGNIANGSPIGDSSPALIALGATILLNLNGKHRTIPIEEFFIKYGLQNKRKGEFIESINMPRKEENFRCYKISKRFDQDISAICGCFNITIKKETIINARIAFGGMAEIPKRAIAVEDFLIGSSWSEETISKACLEFENDFNPISDMRASSKYRNLVAKNLLKKYFIELSKTEKNTNVLRVAI